MKHRLVYQIVQEKKFVWTLGLSACVEWILNFVQEKGVRTDLQRSWFHPTNSLPEFLDLWNKDWSTKNYCTREEICLGPWTVCMCGMELELWTRDGCKNWPTKELAPPNKFSFWVSWSMKQGLVFKIVQEKKFVFVLGQSACVEWKLEIVERNIFVVGKDFKVNFTFSWSIWKLWNFLYF